MSDSTAEGNDALHITHILLIDDDPIFRLGFSTALDPFPDVQVVAQADTGAAALEILHTTANQNTIDLVVLELALGRSNPNQLSGLLLCQVLKIEYPNLPVLLLTAQSELLLLMRAREFGVDGYCFKGCDVTVIVQAIRQLMSGQFYWQTLSALSPAQVNSVRPSNWRSKVRQSGLRQIENTLMQVTQQLQNPDLANLDWLFWSGRRRELLAARWLVNQLLPADVIVVEKSGSSSRVGEQASTPSENPNFKTLTGTSPIPEMTSGTRPVQNSKLSTQNFKSERSEFPPRSLLSTSTSSSELSQIPQSSSRFEVTWARLQSGLANFTGIVLEIDSLQTEKKQELLQLVLRKFEGILDQLRFSQVTLEQLPQKRSQILQDLWQVSVTDFFGKYYTLSVENQNVEVVDTLLQYASVVQDAILDKIPFVIELLSHQLFETPLVIDNVAYSGRTPEAMARAELLLQNLIIQVANAIIQPLLNEFSDIETIKQNFYNLQLISSREIARFRNNLSWRYRWLQLSEEPRAIFESRYDLFVLTDTGIRRTSIYAPRREELEQLRGIPLIVTLSYEIRDAIAPRLQAAVAWVGKGIVYVLTQVVGKSIGLVVRGVIQGIGNTLQDTRFGKK